MNASESAHLTKIRLSDRVVMLNVPCPKAKNPILMKRKNMFQTQLVPDQKPTQHRWLLPRMGDSNKK
ncbi:hypothetical protein OS493_000806 [Desmophyllum pertusum]|uniref:Uncharacterized protein n=1 Tax=Desmophyllum pertusum TaxID=174260 RepID=A0A9X0D5P9_9CNID|nr:hypothetical protein OS493_000806 [Desmophyllum pertusum]